MKNTDVDLFIVTLDKLGVKYHVQDDIMCGTEPDYKEVECKSVVIYEGSELKDDFIVAWFVFDTEGNYKFIAGA